MNIRMLAPWALLASCPLFAATHFSVDDARVLGEQVAHLAENADAGTTPSTAQISALQRRFVEATASADGADIAARRKLMAVATRFGELKANLARGPASGAERTPRAQIDLEVISSSHGHECANAIGLSLDRQIRVSLAKGAGAWLFIPAGDTENLRFYTQSSGPDPTLEIFDACGTGAKSIGVNDDTVGLDADVVVATAASRNLYVHLTNTGRPGTVLVSAATATGTISGTVKDGKTGLPIANVSLQLYSSDGFGGGYGYGYTDQNGSYSITPVQPGTYFVVANADSYVTQLYPTGYCPYGIYYYSASCDTSHAKTVTVTQSGAVSNVNFSLSKGQKIFGQVRGTNNIPVSGATVILEDPNGQNGRGATTDGAGHYSFSTVAPATYALQASAQGFGSQEYNHVACGGPTQSQCNVLIANLLTIGAQDAYDVNFDLPQLSSVSGNVADSGGHPIANVSVYVVDAYGAYTSSGQTDATGKYVTGPVGLGTYYVYADGYTVFAKLYPDHDCVASCGQELNDGTSFTFSAYGQSAQADFVMDYLPALSGHITDSTSGLPLVGVQVLLNSQPPSQSGYSSMSAVTDAAGYYIIPNVPDGAFYAWAQSPDHVDQIYKGIACEALYFYSTANCNVSGATLLTVTTGEQTVPPFDFVMNPSPSISGRGSVRAGSGSDIPAALVVNIYDGTGANVGGANTDVSGNYTVSDLAPGTYYAVATANNGSYIAQIWKNIDCLTCVATTGTPIVIANGSSATGVDFQVTRIDAITGRVVDTHGDPIAGTAVDLFSASTGAYVSGGASDANGYYMAYAPTGASYYVATEAGGNYVDQVYSGIACANGTAYDHTCPLTGGTIVNVSPNSTQPHIVNFALKPNDTVFSNGFE